MSGTLERAEQLARLAYPIFEVRRPVFINGYLARDAEPNTLSQSAFFSAARALKAEPGVHLNSQECAGAIAVAFRAAGITIEEPRP